MEIKGIHEIYKIHTAPSSSVTAAKPEETAKYKTDAGGQDVISISPRASFQTSLSNEVKKFAASARSQDTASSERLAALKEKYQGDNCPVTGAEVASAMMQRICGYPYITQ